MKTLLKTALIASAFTSLAATATMYDTDTDSAVFNIGGTIEEMCKVKSTSNLSASSLVIDASVKVQDIGTLEVWCNTGRAAVTKYSSANKGYLVSGDNKVAYTLDVGTLASDIILSNEYTVSGTTAGSDVNGETESHALKIRPIATGLEFAGKYSDTITVTVSYN